MRRFISSLIFMFFILGCFFVTWLAILRMPDCDYYSYKWNIKGGLAEKLGEAIRKAYYSWKVNRTKTTTTVKIPDIGIEKTVQLFTLSRRAENYICVLVTIKNCRIFEESGIGHIMVRIDGKTFSEGVGVSISRNNTIVLFPKE